MARLPGNPDHKKMRVSRRAFSLNIEVQMKESFSGEMKWA